MLIKLTEKCPFCNVEFAKRAFFVVLLPSERIRRSVPT